MAHFNEMQMGVADGEQSQPASIAVSILGGDDPPLGEQLPQPLAVRLLRQPQLHLLAAFFGMVLGLEFGLHLTDACSLDGAAAPAAAGAGELGPAPLWLLVCGGSGAGAAELTFVVLLLTYMPGTVRPGMLRRCFASALFVLLQAARHAGCAAYCGLKVWVLLVYVAEFLLAGKWQGSGMHAWSARTCIWMLAAGQP